MVVISPIDPSSRGHKKREKTRNQLISAALRVFGEKGEVLTVSDVVAEAEVSNGTFYNYFADRDQLFDVLAEHLASILAVQAAVEIEAEDAALRFATVSARVIARAAEDPTWGTIVLRLGALRPDVREQVTRYMREDLQQGYAQGRFEVGADDVIVDLVAATLLIAIRRIVDGRGSLEYVVGALSRVLRALGVPKDEIRGIAEQAVADAGLVLD
jgi:AcrR family transcriptional regulator